MSSADDLTEIEAVIARFYAAFEARSLEDMGSVWDRSDRCYCVHPGWPILHGWKAVYSSWFTLFNNTQRLQFIVFNERVELHGDFAWVFCAENLLDEDQAGSLSSINYLGQVDGLWRIIGHVGLWSP